MQRKRRKKKRFGVFLFLLVVCIGIGIMFVPWAMQPENFREVKNKINGFLYKEDLVDIFSQLRFFTGFRFICSPFIVFHSLFTIWHNCGQVMFLA